MGALVLIGVVTVGVAEGAAKAGRDPSEIDLIIPVFAIPGDSAEECAPGVLQAKTHIGFYGATPNYAFQFEDLGYEGMRDKLRACLKTGDNAALAAMISDEMLDHFGLVARWDDLADKLIARYRGSASRIAVYLAEDSIRQNPDNLGKWSEIAGAVRTAA